MAFLMEDFSFHPLTEDLTIVSEDSIRDLISERKRLERACLTKACATRDGGLQFVKTTGVDSFPSRLRIAFGLRRRTGNYDWPLAELRNNLTARTRTDATPALIGYGFIKKLGLVKEMFLIYEHLDGFVHGLAWLRRHPTCAVEFAEAALALLFKLNNCGIYHLDYWAGNLMIKDRNLNSMKAIDFENCFMGHTKHPNETFGFQCAFLYQFALSDFITEACYDDLVKKELSKQGRPLNEVKFSAFYERFKHHGAGRKERYLIPDKGTHIEAKPAKRTVY